MIMNVPQVILLILSLMGLFGNFQLLWLYVRKPKLRTKPGFLVCFLSILHILCILWGWVHSIVYYYFGSLTDTECLPLMGIFMLFMVLQSFLLLFLGIDLICSLLIPFRYSNISTTLFAVTSSVLLLIPSSLCILIVIKGMKESTTEKIQFCTPVQGLPPSLLSFWMRLVASGGFPALLIYTAAIVVFKIIGGTKSARRKLIRNTCILLSFFILLLACGIMNRTVTEYFGKADHVVELSFIISEYICVVLFSDLFYISMINSKELRRYFIEQCYIMTCRLPPKPQKTHFFTTRSYPQ